MSRGWSKSKRFKKALLVGFPGLLFGFALLLMLPGASEILWLKEVVPWIMPGLVGLVAAFGVGEWAWKRILQRRLAQRMSREGEELGLLFQPTEHFPVRCSYRASREWAGTTVRFHADWDFGGSTPALGFRAVVDAELPPNLNIARNEPGAFDYHAPPGSPSVKIAGGLTAYSTGIPSFDTDFEFREAREATLLLVLGARSREAIRAAVGGGGLRVEEGQVVWRGLETLPSNAEMEEKVSLMKELASALEEFASVEPSEGLLHHVKNDPEQGFRLRCFDVLLSDFSESPSAAEAIRFAESADDPTLRFLAEFQRGEPRREVIAELLRGGELPEPMKVRGLHLVGDAFAGSLSVDKGGTAGGLSVQPSGEGGLSRAEEPERRPRGQKLKS